MLAGSQTAGRGRYGRQWESPRGNLYASFVFRPPLSPRYAAQIGYVAAVAVYDTVAALTGRPGRRWPVNGPTTSWSAGRKLPEILPESSIGADGALEWIVLGIGINIVSAPADAVRPATSLLAQGGAGLDTGTVLAALGRTLDRWMLRWLGDGFGSVRQAWLDRAGAAGRRDSRYPAGPQYRGPLHQPRSRRRPDPRYRERAGRRSTAAKSSPPESADAARHRFRQHEYRLRRP